MPINKITLKIPESAKTMLRNPSSMFYKSLKNAITDISLTVVRNVRKNVTVGWNMKHRTRMPFFTGKLNRSITFEQSGLKTKIGSNVIYAEILEYGGDIVPKRAKALFIPLTHLGRKVGAVKGGSDQLEYGKDFIFSQKVTIKPKAYFERGMETSFKEINSILNEMLAKLGAEGGLK